MLYDRKTIGKWWGLMVVEWDSMIVLPSSNDCYITMENHDVQWEHPLFLWPFSIAMSNDQGVPHLLGMIKAGKPMETHRKNNEKHEEQ